MKSCIKHIKTNLVLAVLLLGLFLSSCVEEYWPEIVETNDFSLVVDGNISNQAGPYTVRLSKTKSINDTSNTPLVGASMKFINQNGSTQDLVELKPGTYQTTDPNFTGQIGDSYKLQIVTPSGEIYESSYETILDPVAIESVEMIEESKIIDETSQEALPGFQFYVSSAEMGAQKNYVYWELEETYEHHADYKILYVYEGFFVLLGDGAWHIPRALDFHKTLYKCWTVGNVAEMFTAETSQLSVAKFNQQPLHFIPYENDKLKVNYSLHVKQHKISEEAFRYLKAIQDQNSGQGSFYSTQPFQVKGNIRNINNPGEEVLGYFLGIGTSEPERLFTRRPPGSIPGKPSWEIDCGSPIYNTADDPALSLLYQNADEAMYPIYTGHIMVQDYGVSSPEAGNGTPIEVLAYLPYPCADCRIHGGTTTKPNYWIDF